MYGNESDESAILYQHIFYHLQVFFLRKQKSRLNFKLNLKRRKSGEIKRGYKSSNNMKVQTLCSFTSFNINVRKVFQLWSFAVQTSAS